MAVIRHEDLAGLCVPHLEAGETVRGCIEAMVLDVNGSGPRSFGRILLAFTGTRLLTLAWREGVDPVVDGVVPAELVACADVEDAPVGVTLEVALTTGAVVRFGVGAGQDDAARALASALVAAQPPVRVAASTEELPVVDSAGEVAARVELAAALAVLCERDLDRHLELLPGVVLEARPGTEATYFVHVAPQVQVEGGCPRCRHRNRPGAVFCDACGALL